MVNETVHQEGGTVFAVLTDEQRYQALLKAHQDYGSYANHPASNQVILSDKKSLKQKTLYHHKEVKQLLSDIKMIAKQCQPDTVDWIENSEHIKFFKDIQRIVYRRKIENVLNELFPYSAVFKSLKDMIGMHNQASNKGKKKRMKPHEKDLYQKILSLEKILFQKP